MSRRSKPTRTKAMANTPRLWRALLEQAAEVLLAVSADGRIVYVNAAVEPQYGYRPDDLLGVLLTEVIHPEDRATVGLKFEQMISGEESRCSCPPHRLRTAGGEWRWVQMVGENFLADGGVRALLVRVRDVPPDTLPNGELNAGSPLATRDLFASTEQEQHAFAEALGDAAGLLERVEDDEQVLDGLLETIGRIVPSDTATILMREGEQMQVVRSRGFERLGLGDWIRTVTFPANLIKFRILAEHNAPLLIPDTRQYPQWVDLPESAWIRSHISAPIRIGGETVGVLGLDSATPELYRPEDGARLFAFAQLAASALQNARLLRQTRERAEQLSLLYDVGLTLNRVLDARTQLDFLFKIARRALHSDRMAFFRYRPGDEMLELELGVGLPADVEQRLKLNRLSVHAPDSLVGWVAQHRVPARVGEVNEDPRFLHVDSTVHSAVAVPVEHEQELRGVLIAISEAPDAFSAQDERLLVLFGNQVAAAMELSRLFQEQARRQHEMETLREASLAFTAETRQADLLVAIREYAVRLVRATRAEVVLRDSVAVGEGGRRELLPATTAEEYGGALQEVLATGEWQEGRVTETGESVAALPLKSGGQMLGALGVAFAPTHPPDRAEWRALSLLADAAAVALEKVRHTRDTEKQLRDAQLLHRAGEALNRNLSVEETVVTLASLFLQAVDVDACCLWSVDLAREEFRVLLDVDPIAAMRLEIGSEPLAVELAHLRRLVGMRRTCAYRRDDPGLPQDVAQVMDTYGYKSYLVIPLLTSDETIGIVEMADREQLRDFDPDGVRLAESLAHQAASALHNARLYEETRHRAEQLTLLNRIARQVSGARTLEELIEMIEHQALVAVQHDSYFVALYYAATVELEFRRFVDRGIAQDSFRWTLGPSLTRHVIVQGRALRVNTRAQMEQPENAPRIFGNGPLNQSWLGAPMRSGDQVVGVISVQSQRPYAYGESDELLLQTIADQVAVAVERLMKAEEE